MTVVLLVGVGIALGLALGLFGGGGGILAVPLLVAVGVPTDEAATASLVVVGLAALTGLLTNARTGRVAWSEGLIFGGLGVLAAMLGSFLALRAPDALKLWGFSALMVVSGALMLRRALQSSTPDNDPQRPRRWLLVIPAALLVGLATGFFGVGGGFLVVPALTLLLGMPMLRATATALLVIVINSAAALVPRSTEALDLAVAIPVAAAAMLASVIAARWSNRWSGRSLTIGFAVLVLAMAVLVGWEALQS